MSDYLLKVWIIKAGWCRLVHNILLYVGFGSASTICVDNASATQTGTRVSSVFECHINQVDIIFVLCGWDKNSGQHNIIAQQTVSDCQAVNMALQESLSLRLKCASVALWVHLWGEVSCLRLMETVHLFSGPIIRRWSPFSEALRRWGGRLLSQTQSLMHLRPIYSTEIPPQDPICLAMVKLNTNQN